MHTSNNAEVTAGVMTPADVQALLKDDLQQVERAIREQFQSEVAIIPMISGYLTDGGGKRLRPMLVLATAKLCDHNDTGKQVIHSVVAEYIHAATLLHDDVVDEADLRRGIESANAKWGNEYSVLVGDFLFAKSFALMAAHSPPGVVQAVSQATTYLAEGEILELVHTADLETTEEQYLNLVFRKTGALIKACCQIGGLLGGVDKDKMKALETYGENVGIAFQLIDDLLDFTADEKTLGKPVGADLAEGHVTLPVLHAYKSANPDEKKRLEEIVSDPDTVHDRMDEVLALVEKYRSLEYGRTKAEQYVAKATEALDVFDNNKYLDALKGLAEYIVNRNL